jgi:hypothetical protein
VAIFGIVAPVALSRHRSSKGGSERIAVTTSGAQELPKGSLLFRSTALDRNFGKVAVVPSDDPQGPRSLTPLTCDRVDFEGGRGICVASATTLFGSTRALVFDDRFRILHTVQLNGIPSRARVSPDGRYATVTDFVSGDTYATLGFSTRTDLIDLQTGSVLFDLESLHVRYNGAAFQAVDFNFWGVTFASDGQHFFATLGTGGHTYLIAGDVATRQATVLRSGVECPSLSPDGMRIAFKKRNPGSVITWRISVLDLSTLADHYVAETRNVDDQVGWLSNDTLVYGLPTTPAGSSGPSASTPGLPATPTGSVSTDTWTVPASGAGAPKLLVRGAWSSVLIP